MTSSPEHPSGQPDETKPAHPAPVVPPVVHVPSKDAPRGGLIGQIVMVLIVLILCGAAAWWWSHHQANQGVESHTAAAPAEEVDFHLVKPADAPINLDYLGQAAFSQRVEIRARVKGFLETRSFEEGGMVKEGQLLYRIEQTTFKAALDAAKAQLAQAQARYAQAQREVARITTLRAENAASQRELDDWKTNLEVSAADIESAKAAIQQAQLNLDYTTIASPMNGVISQTLKDVGNYVGDGSSESLLAVVGQVNPIYVQFPVSEQDLLRWRTLSSSDSVDGPKNDLRVEALLSDGSTYPQKGKLNFVDTSVDPATGTAMVRAVFENDDYLLKPGQFIRVKIIGLQRKNVLAVPQKAVLQSPSGAMVYVIDEKQTAQIRPIKLGQWFNDQWIIDQGLEEGDKVIVNRLLRLRPGVEVKATLAPVDSDKE